jgi:hypothetical protein
MNSFQLLYLSIAVILFWTNFISFSQEEGKATLAAFLAALIIAAIWLPFYIARFVYHLSD